MWITRIIKIDGRDVRFRASAAIPRLYRERFGRDIFSDLRQIGEVDPDEPVAGSSALTLFEDIAYVMAKYEDPFGVPETTEEWLDGFGAFSVCRAMPEITALWRENLRTSVESKKNSIGRTGT